MSFPEHDPYWRAAADFVRRHARPGETILAPDIFWWRLDSIHRYAHANCMVHYDWAIIHKGELDRLSRALLAALPAKMTPVFANAVFVIWTTRGTMASLDRKSDHVRALTEQIARGRGRRNDVPEPATGGEVILPDPAMITKFATLAPEQLRASMNAFWRNGGYRYDTPRDQAYFKEIDAYTADYAGDMAGETVLDLCCGLCRPAAIAPNPRLLVGIEISEVALQAAKSGPVDARRNAFAVMDAHALGFARASFDTVLLVEAIEHVRDADVVIAEIARVIKPGGKLFLTSANSASVHQVVATKLGFPPFHSNYQHIREFSFPQAQEMLARHGFSLARSGGIFLYPYWGIPGIHEKVGEITDNDHDVVELFRALGRQIGPQHAYAFAILARKQ
ncbi:MAG: class I SAM-dependent methyltransferase [Proteobacteria bacterium]|nr:class I SAM-dependent methyltransferase [Pseudomonadota bacterium]